MTHRHSGILLSIALAAGGLALGRPALAADFTRTTLQEQPFPGPQYHTVTAKTVIQPGGEVPRHTHPGVEMGYITAGHAVVSIEGRAPQTVGPGDSFSVPAGVIHSVRTVGGDGLTIVSTYVVDRNQPLSSPAH